MLLLKLNKYNRGDRRVSAKYILNIFTSLRILSAFPAVSIHQY